MTAATPHFDEKLFKFLQALKRNNKREWFKANKARYEAEVRDPMLRFIADFERHLHAISPHFVADPRPVGGSLFRIYRDTRFAKDKTPYKTTAGAHFRHARAKDVHAPGFYLHLEPDGVFAASGIWHPDAATLAKIRAAIASDAKSWQRITSAKALSKVFSLGGDSLKRAPKGYDPEHPLIEDLRRKDFIVVTPLTEAEACAPDFLPRFAKLCRTAAPFTAFLTEAVELPW